MSGIPSGTGINKYFSRRVRESREDKYRRLRAAANAPRLDLVDRVDQLEEDFGRALLLLQTLAEVSVDKGLMTRKEIAKMAERVDMADGVKDGKLDPVKLRPKDQQNKKTTPTTPRAHLRDLEERDRARDESSSDDNSNTDTRGGEGA